MVLAHSTHVGTLLWDVPVRGAVLLWIAIGVRFSTVFFVRFATFKLFTTLPSISLRTLATTVRQNNSIILTTLSRHMGTVVGTHSAQYGALRGEGGELLTRRLVVGRGATGITLCAWALQVLAL